jgi:hypothetical protein
MKPKCNNCHRVGCVFVGKDLPFCEKYLSEEKAAQVGQSGLATGYVVKVNKMEESHRVTWWVCIDRADRPQDAKPWDEGRMTPFMHENKEYADIEAMRWAEFFGVLVTT